MRRTRKGRGWDDGPSRADIATNFDPARLTQARHLAGQSRQDIAETIGVTPAAVGQYESGITRPRPDLIPRIADHLGVPSGFLTTGRPHAHLAVDDAHFTDPYSSVIRRRKAVAAIEQTWELVFALEKRVELPYVDLPGFGGGEMLADDRHPHAVARDVRAAWGITGPMPHLTRQLELHGIIVANPPVAEDIAALGAHSTARLPRPIIIPTPGAAGDVYRWRWDLAHHLGRMLMHSDGQPSSPGRRRDADLFAAELLLPSAEVTHHLGGALRTARIFDLCRVWGAPADALVTRRLQLGLVGRQAVGRARVKAPRMPIADFPGEVPTLIARAFDVAGEVGVSVRSLANELAWTDGRVSELLGMQDRRPVLRLVV